jgi:NADH dehydrogenase [ubiquinone] 1 alpha subcomplex assembly factor 6
MSITDSEWSALTKRLAARVMDHLSAARVFAKQVPAAAAPALLPATLADAYLHRLRRNGHDLFEADMLSVGTRTLLKLLWRARIGRY